MPPGGLVHEVRRQRDPSKLQMNIKETLTVLERWKAGSQLFISLSPPFAVRFEVDRSVMRDALSQSHLSEDEFRTASNEVGLILLHVLNGTEERYVSGFETEDVDETGADTGASQEQRRAYVAEVKSRIYDDYLQRRYDLKRSSKAPSFNGVDWDVKVKRFDANFDDFQAFPYATLRLSFQRDFDDSPFAILGGRTFDSVQINFSKDEVDHLIRVPSRTRERLVELEGEETWQ